MTGRASTGDSEYGALLTASRLSVTLMGFFSAGALFLALTGIYGLVASSVVQRKLGLGIRIALGASASSIRGMVVREALRPAGVGLAIGATLGLAAATSLRHVLRDLAV